MRTVLIIVVLVLVAVAAGGSFVVRGGAQEPDATLDYSCEPAGVPEGVETLLRCRAVMRNNSSDVLRDVQFGFVPATNVPSPDRWYFFAARLDGVRFEVDRGQINYSIGDIEAGQERVLELDVIVRVGNRPSGAIAWLSLGGDDRELAQELVVIEPQQAAPPVTMRLQLSQNMEDLRRFQALLTVADAGRRIDAFTADLGLQDHMSIPDAFARQEEMLGEEVFGEKFHLTLVRSDPPSPEGTEVTIGFEIYTEAPCQGGSLAIVGYVHAPDGEVSRPALVSELPIDPACYDAEAAPVGVTSLGQGGFGPGRADVEATIALVAMLVGLLGFATVGMAIFLVR